MMGKTISILLMSLAASCAAAQQDSDLNSAFSSSAIVIEADEYNCYHFDVYVATSYAQQRRGLMHVRQLARSTGMLFVYDRPGMRSMWMKNTFIPLDILFIRGDGTVESIASNTEPLSLKSISSGEPVVYVLELNAGVTGELGIGTNSRIHFAVTE